MKAILYKITCLTNLHVGNEGSSFSVVDKEVERDFDGTPIVHASGIKGALRSIMPADNAEQKQLTERLFGKASNSDDGTHRGVYCFMDATMLYRPLRVRGANVSFLPVVTVSMVKHFLELTNSFGCCPVQDVPDWDGLDFGDNEFLCNMARVRVEDEKTGNTIPQDIEELLKKLVGPQFAIAKSLDDYRLPVIARNKLENGISRNLWYEEYVPHDSGFYTIILVPDSEDKVALPLEQPIQLGGNATVGYGYVKLEQWGGVGQ